jgi:uncharacterized protein (DUF3820 family)
MDSKTIKNRQRKIRRNHKDRQNTKMPFGKYKGYFFKDVPYEYLEWAAKHWVDQQYRPILTLVVEEIEHRYFSKQSK